MTVEPFDYVFYYQDKKVTRDILFINVFDIM